MIKIRIISIGKTKEKWLKEAMNEYQKRLGSLCEINWLLVKTEAKLEAAAKAEENLICLDSGGKQMDSEAFSQYLMEKLVRQGAKIAFLIGGAEGIPENLKKRSQSISLSPMTFTHQMVRLILLEQIYRAFEIEKGSLYHK